MNDREEIEALRSIVHHLWGTIERGTVDDVVNIAGRPHWAWEVQNPDTLRIELDLVEMTPAEATAWRLAMEEAP